MITIEKSSFTCCLHRAAARTSRSKAFCSHRRPTEQNTYFLSKSGSYSAGIASWALSVISCTSMGLRATTSFFATEGNTRFIASFTPCDTHTILSKQSYKALSSRIDLNALCDLPSFSISTCTQAIFLARSFGEAATNFVQMPSK